MYSQSGEDDAILKAVANVKGGKFLDIGAADPKVISNTRALYEAGWGGVCIEPSPLLIPGLLAEYGKDYRVRVFQAVVGCESIVTDLHLNSELLSTTDAKHKAKWAEAHWLGHFLIHQITLETVALMFGGFNFVSIDTEGTSVELALRMLKLGWEPECFCVEHDKRMDEVAIPATRRGYQLIFASAENAVFVRVK